MMIAKVWLPLTIADLPIVDHIADTVHTDLPERTEVFAEKLKLFPQGCFKFVYDNQIAGYGISHPWRLFSIPALDSFLVRCPDDPDCLYIHDVAILKKARGHNASGDYMSIMKLVAKRLSIPNIACVSVYGTDVLWSRFGFEEIRSEDLSEKLVSYGESAKYMVAIIS
jgi:hypothetical protein